MAEQNGVKETAIPDRIRKNGWCETHESRETLGTGRCLAFLNGDVPESTHCFMTDQWVDSGSTP